MSTASQFPQISDADPILSAPDLAFETRQLHAGAAFPDIAGARRTPIYLTAGFEFNDFEDAHDRFTGTNSGPVYTRIGNPTTAAVESRLAALEGGIDALVVASGQAAVSVALFGLLRAGDHVVAAANIYEGSRNLLSENLANLGITTSFVAQSNDLNAWREAVRPNTRAFFAESIANPRNEVLDIAAVAAIAHDAGAPLLIDNTLATPYLLRPIEHGADIVIHSASKFLAGHGSALAGVIVDSGRFAWAGSPHTFTHLHQAKDGKSGTSFVDRFGPHAYLQYARDVIAARLGPVVSPFHAFLLEQGLETLSIRVERQTENALALASWLAQQPEVESVEYAGLPDEESHVRVTHYLPQGGGSVFSFTLRGGRETARAVFDALQVFTRMTHLGDTRSLVIHPATTTHALRSADERAVAGITDGLLRVSIGLESVADLQNDLQRAFTLARQDTHPRAAHSESVAA
ncbi:O-acetylhomoserine aminocarboxypropyltransferase/cysteine synthase family protein [Humidisolicoccus flavus]|uniref:O-acetylhomoserine aminocarboxypropyltransferase/cysteine synthase family protein n=1 Tax=Humidisolicoccus flavus TaxID=3111414 RepID=UPI003243312F